MHIVLDIIFSIWYHKGINHFPAKGGGEKMPNTAEIIEKLARQLERQRMLTDLKECKTLEDFQKLTEKYESLCRNDSE